MGGFFSSGVRGREEWVLRAFFSKSHGLSGRIVFINLAYHRTRLPCPCLVHERALYLQGDWGWHDERCSGPLLFIFVLWSNVDI